MSPPGSDQLSHTDDAGRPVMVDVSTKAATWRSATASGRIVMSADAFARVRTGDLPKGAVTDVARVAGIQAAKRTAELVPMCHPLRMSHVDVSVTPQDDEAALVVTSTVAGHARTGFEMEALTAVTVALLTIYDMSKAVDKGMTIEGIRLVRKQGGASGDYAAPEPVAL